MTRVQLICCWEEITKTSRLFLLKLRILPKHSKLQPDNNNMNWTNKIVMLQRQQDEANQADLIGEEFNFPQSNLSLPTPASNEDKDDDMDQKSLSKDQKADDSLKELSTTVNSD